MTTKRLSWGIGIICIAMLVGLLGMAVNQAQIAARKMQSSNNLKSIGLAFHNYESAFKKLPAGCDRDEKHGWQTYINPFMEASSWYSQVDQRVSWEHPFNFYKFRIKAYGYQNLVVSSTYTSEGYSLTHYLANARLLYRDSKTKFSEIEAGLSNVWFAGEIDSKYPPFGYPYNWRELEWPLNAKNGGFGAWNEGAFFSIGDGSVQFVSSSVDRAVIEQLTHSSVQPDPEKTRVPDRTFQCGGIEFERKGRGFGDEDEMGIARKRSKNLNAYTAVYFDLDQHAEVIILPKLGTAADKILSEYPDAWVVEFGSILNASTADLISHFKNLEALKVSSIVEPEQVIETLKSMQRLKYLHGNFDADLLEQLRAALPTCEVSTTATLNSR